MLGLREQLSATTATHALLTTFALSPALFESQIIRPLLEAGCDEILLLVDRAGYEALLTERSALAHAGCSYWIGCVDLFPRAFHPKVALLWSADTATAFVMSANLTRGGLSTNVEIVDRLTWSRTAGGPMPQVRGVAEWFGKLATVLPIAPAIASTLQRMLAQFPSATNAPDVDDGVYFVHNLDEPIYDHVIRHAPPDTTEVLVAAPFHERSLRPIAAIAARFPSAKLTVAQGRHEGTIDPAAVPTSLRKKITVALCSAPGRQQRAWHAKVAVFKGRRYAAFFSGSANCTRPGFLESKSDGGNVEAGVIRRLEDSDEVSRIFDQIKLKTITLDALRFEQVEPSEVVETGPTIVWAEIAGSTLTIDLAGTDPRDTASVDAITLLTGKGLRRVSPGQRRADAASLRVTCAVDRAIEETLGDPIVLQCDLRRTPRALYRTVRCVVMCPEEIRLPPSVKRVRQAMRNLERRDPRSGDVREVVLFVQETLATLLVHVGPAPTFQTTGQRPTRETCDTAPGVVLAEDHPVASFALHATGIRTVGNVLSALPSIFQRLLEEPSSQRRTAAWGTVRARDESDVEDVDVDEPSAIDTEEDVAELEEDAVSFVAWACAAFEEDPASDAEALRQWPTCAYLLEFLLIFIRYFYRRITTPETDNSVSAQYRARSRDILTAALSTEGAAWGKPTGWFVRAHIKAGNAAPQLRNALVARVAHRVAELAADTPPGTDASWLRHALDGLDRIAETHPCERSAAVVAHIPALLAEAQTSDSADLILATLADVRRHETRETAAASKFALLTRLQNARIRVIDLDSRALSPKSLQHASPAIAEAVNEYRGIERRCLAAFPEETNVYLENAARGRARVFVHLEDGGTICPHCHLGVPAQRAADLRILTKVTECPNCRSLIIPLPSAACRDHP